MLAHGPRQTRTQIIHDAGRLERKSLVSDVVRISAKAVVVQRGRILLLENVDSQGNWYSLPGGGQEHGEILEEALVRECHEEAGVRVRMGRLLFIRDCIARNHEFAESDGDAHQVELMFECEISVSSEASLGSVPDDMQTGVAWVPLDKLRQLRLYPMAVAQILADGVPRGDAVYLGDVN